MHRVTSLLIVGGILIAACSSDGDSTSPTTEPTAPTTTEAAVETTSPDTTTAGTRPTTIPASDPTGFTVSPGTEQLTVTDARPGSTLTVLDAADQPVADGVADELGALVVRDLTGGETYRVTDEDRISDQVTTFARDEHPDPMFYAEQVLVTDGLGYIATRDGTTLSASVRLPGPADEGPYPTVVEYSGYDPSNPDEAGFADLYNALGYAYVGVNVRGSGCSGGSFQLFEYSQNLDGYDVVETVAAQPWVYRNRVGMVGISYPGITQLFVAQTQPPSLAAITPLSVVADLALSTLYPGGILNTGFAVEWAADRDEQAQPANRSWVEQRIADGDDTCAANQELRLQSVNSVGLIEANPYWNDVAAELAPRLFVDRIEVPTYLAGAWQDEQTGGHFPTMLDRFTGTDRFYASMTNGLHIDALGAAMLPRLIEFLDLYVAERTPSLGAARFILPIAGPALFGTSDLALPTEDRFAGMTYDDALAAFEAEPPIQILFEHGAADGATPLAPLARYEASFDAWPIPEATATRWFLNGSSGRLGDAPSEVDAPTTYLALPDAIPPTWHDPESGSLWTVDVALDWQEGGAGTFAAFATDPLTEETVVIGSGSVDLWMQSNLGDTDVEVTVSEIRPDGQELYVQSGWLRASHRALDEGDSTELRPVHTHLEADAAPLPDAVFDLVRVELFPFAHTFRAGSRIRLVIDAPGGNRPLWEFRTIAGGEQVTIAHDDLFPSSLVLPVVPGVDAPDEYPDCSALRGQPCRPYSGD